MITGDTVPKRKRALAALVKAHIESLGMQCDILENQTNSKGHKDLVLIKSDIGLLHLTATSSDDPNASISIVGFADKKQDFLADKAFVVFGWNTKDKRTFLMFVEPEKLLGIESLSRIEITSLRNKKFSVVLTQ